MVAHFVLYKVLFKNKKIFSCVRTPTNIIDKNFI